MSPACILAGSTGRSVGLELFAREMHAGWTSVGDEVLRFQDASLFKHPGPAQ
jgi:N6-adenosine-specific RNA methylase IME4